MAAQRRTSFYRRSQLAIATLASFLILCVGTFSSTGTFIFADAGSVPTATSDPNPQPLADDVVVTIGFIRMAADALDSPNTLSAFYATIRYYNNHRLARGIFYQLNVTTVMCMTLAACQSLSDANQAQVDAFIAAMPYMSVVMRPNFILSQQIVDEAIRMGCPVVNAEDMRPQVFAAGAENIIQFHQNWESQAAHLFAYFQQNARCAYSAIVHDNSQMSKHDYYPQIRVIQKLFTDGAFALPPEMDAARADDATFKDFFMRDTPRRRCFIVLGTNSLMNDVLRRLAASDWYVPANYRFFGFNTLASDVFKLNGSAAHYESSTFTTWIPTMTSDFLTSAFKEWGDSPNPAELAFYAPNESPLAEATLLSLGAYLIIRLTMEAIRDAISYATEGTFYKHSIGAPSIISNTADLAAFYPLKQPVSWSAILDSFYRYAREVDGHWFNHLVRECPRYPATQMCHCNTLTAFSYIYNINTTTGVPYIVYDNRLTGDRDIAAPTFTSGSCGYNISAWAYPLTGLALYPTSLIGRVGYRQEDLARIYNEFQATYGEVIANTNWAAVKPVRAMRYAPYNINDNEDPTTMLQHYIDTIKPFVIYGTMGVPITDSGTTLTLETDFLRLDLEDAPLTSHDEWRWNIVQLRPTIADYIHTLASYYESKVHTFSSFHAIAQTDAEALLIHKSFATFGFNVPIKSITVTNDNLLWTTTISSWISNAGSYNPFVIASAHANNNSDVQAIAKIAAALGRGTLALACDLRAIYNARAILDFSTYNTQGDILFGFFGRETWIPSAKNGTPASLLQYVETSTAFQIAMLGVEFTKALAGQVYYDYTTTAAEVLYNLGTVTARGASFGPFYNDTCDEETIRLNSRDRRCQCTKGLRTVYLHSMRNFVAGTTSARTGRYSYTMNTCGVEYADYVAPPSSSSAALSSGAIAGVAVGCIAGVGIIVGALVLILGGGRNNKAAPKDNTRPFTIVFTDIQSSTALWARAPNAMSDAVDQHHHLLRKALRRNDGYEVKTVGDSFMVAFQNVEDAVRFSLDVQVALYEDEWNNEIDATYVELLLEAEAGLEELRRVAETEPTVTDNSTTVKPQPPLVTMNHRPSGGGDTMSLISRESIPASKMGHSPSVHNGALHALMLNAAGPADSTQGPSVYNGQSIRAYAPSVSSYSAVNAGPPSVVPAATGGGAKLPSRADSSAADEVLVHTIPVVGGYDNARLWHGLRVRIGIHHGLGDIRKDPVTQGYDYYGTVVNVAARVEGVGHGGQILITDEVLSAAGGVHELPRRVKAVMIALGPQPLRGLDEPIRLYQLVPDSLQGRTFPPLRLHIEKETEDDSAVTTETGTGTGTHSTAVSESPEVLINRLCNTKQYAMVAPDDLLDRFHYFIQIFGPTSAKYRMSVVAKLGESWGFEKATSAVYGTEGNRTRLLVSLMAKITKTFHAANRGGRAANGRGGGSSSGGGGKNNNSNNNMGDNPAKKDTASAGSSRQLSNLRVRSASAAPSQDSISLIAANNIYHYVKELSHNNNNGGVGAPNNHHTFFPVSNINTNGSQQHTSTGTPTASTGYNHHGAAITYVNNDAALATNTITNAMATSAVTPRNDNLIEVEVGCRTNSHINVKDLSFSR